MLRIDKAPMTNPHKCRGYNQGMVASAVVIDPDVLGGTPCFRGTRVPFKNLIDYLEGGHSLPEFLRQFPSVTHEMAIQALENRMTFATGPSPQFD